MFFLTGAESALQWIMLEGLQEALPAASDGPASEALVAVASYLALTHGIVTPHCEIL